MSNHAANASKRRWLRLPQPISGRGTLLMARTADSDPARSLPRLLTPAEVAKVLGCSEWWVKEQARRRRIPFTKAGGAYRFTTEHVYEIIRLFEQRPTGAEAEPDDTGTRRRVVAEPVRPVVELRARRPRRTRN